MATTEPVADYLLTAMGMRNLTPFIFQADIMNGVDPSPQDISLENGFFTKHQVKVFCYNQQVADSLTKSIRQTAQSAGVPVVGVYETMPTPGYDYQTWMMAEVSAIQAADRAPHLHRAPVIGDPVLTVEDVGVSFSGRVDPRPSLLRDAGASSPV